MTREEKEKILQVIANCVPDNGAAEDEDNLVANFLPLRSYTKLADAKVFLITGDRGAGKTALFKMLTTHDGLENIISESDKSRFVNDNKAVFLSGYLVRSEGASAFPTPNVCSKWVKGKSTEEIMSFWAGLMVSVLLNYFEGDKEIHDIICESLGAEYTDNLRKNASLISSWWEFMYDNEEGWERCLNQLDELFQQRKLQIFITYDELDTMSSEYSKLFPFIRSLLSFWFLHIKRFKNIKAKIFLRNDLYNSKSLKFVDSSKMGSYRMNLEWDTTSLYRVFVKRIANSGEETAVKYLENIPNLLILGKNENLGYLPDESQEKLSQFVEQLIGKYMGKTPKRGFSYTWVPNHIQDANGEVAPRPFLKCFSFAAEAMLDNVSDIDKLEETHLLTPSRLQGALSKTSCDRVAELKEEYHWLEYFIEDIQGEKMLMEKGDFLKKLRIEQWNEAEGDDIPAQSAEEMLKILCELGIIIETTNQRINVPEIYLHGLGLKRSGGIKRPK